MNDIDWSKLTGHIGIFGGTFDPVQIAHVAVIEKVLELKLFDHLIIIPAASNPLKSNSPTVSFEHRYHMLQIATNEKQNVLISNVENNLSQPSYTINTLEYIKNVIPKSTKLSFIGGADLLLDLHKWVRINDILNLIESFYIISRNSVSLEDSINKFIFTNFKNKFFTINISNSLKTVSSTEFRVKNNENIINKEVLKYIKANNLY